MCENSAEIRYDPDRQVLCAGEWIVPIEEVGVERINDYKTSTWKV